MNFFVDPEIAETVDSNDLGMHESEVEEDVETTSTGLLL